MTTPAIAALTGILVSTSISQAVTTAINYGSLGAAANGTHADGVVLGATGPLADPTDTAAAYSGSSTTTPVNTVVPFNSFLNTTTSAPFTIEFWHNPAASDNDDSPIFNRQSAGDRAGWAFFQRNEATGWNFALYNGNGSEIGHQITGGSYVLNTWNHVVAIWDGNIPSLYVNGVDTEATPTGPGGYNVNTTEPFSIGSYSNGGTGIVGALDETAFYDVALTPTQILNHFNAATNTTPDSYSSMVQADGALLYIRNTPVPEPSTSGLMLLGLSVLLRRRR